MDEFNDYAHKGEVLMKQALKKYAEGDFTGGDRDRAEANRFYDLRASELSTDEGKMSMLYGENRNFGIIYNVFESNTKDLFKDSKKKNVIGKFVKLIKENNILKTQFDLYNALSNPTNVGNVENYVNEAIMLLPHFDKKEVRKCNEKLIRFMKDNDINEMVDIDEDTMKLYESIEYFMFNQKHLTNINEFTKAQDVIVESIKKNNVIEESTNNMEKYIEKVNELTEHYNQVLTDEEIKLIQELSQKDVNKEQIFEQYKSETIKAVQSQINENNANEVNSWKNILNKLNEMKYNEATILSNIADFIDIKTTIEE